MTYNALINLLLALENVTLKFYKVTHCSVVLYFPPFYVYSPPPSRRSRS